MPQINTNGTRVHFRLEGERQLPCLVLAHPIGADHGIWDKLVPLLTPQFCVLRYDLRGHGGSEVGVHEYSLAQLADDLLALTHDLGIERFIAAGISLGGLTVLQAALQAPERLAAVIVCSANARMAPPPGGWDGRAQQAFEQGMTSLADGMVQRMFSSSFKDSGDASVATSHNTLALMAPQGYANACAVLRDADLRPLLAQVTQPVLVVSGQTDPLVPPQVGESMAQALPKGRHISLPAGHFPPLEAAPEFAQALLQFAQELGRGK